MLSVRYGSIGREKGKTRLLKGWGFRKTHQIKLLALVKTLMESLRLYVLFEHLGTDDPLIASRVQRFLITQTTSLCGLGSTKY